MITAERQQSGPCTNPLHQQLHGLSLPVTAVQVAQQEHVELLQGRRVRRNPRQLQALHVGPLDEHIRPGLDQGTEFEVGIPGEEPLHDRPVLGPQRPLEVEHPDLAIDDLDHGGPMVVLGDLLFGYRRYADCVGVSSLDGGHELKDDRLRSVTITQDDLGLVERFAVFLQDGLDDLPAEPGLADVSRDPGPVVHGQLLGAVEVGHPRIAIRGAVPQAVAHSDRMDDHSELAGRGHGVARGVVNPIREEHDGLDVPPRDGTRPGHQGPGKRRRLAGRLESLEIAGPVQRRGPFRKLEDVKVEVLLQPGRPVQNTGPRLLEPGRPGGVVGRGHGGRGIQCQDDGPALELFTLQAQDRPEQQEHDQEDRHRPQGQQQSPPRRHDLREDPAVEYPRQHDGRRGDRQHGQEAVPLFERDMKHNACPVLLRPRRFPTREFSHFAGSSSNRPRRGQAGV